jgi:glycosyltransferase involved in cell wall biosynthesis
VLHVITRLDRGGSADNTLLSCLGLDDLGWEVTLAYGRTTEPSPVLSEVERRGSIERVVIQSLVRAVDPISDTRTFRTIRELVGRGGFDLVHTHSSKAGLLGRMAAHGTGARVVHTPHGHVFEGYFNPVVSRAFVFVERLAARWCDRIVVLTDRGREEHLQRGVGHRDQFVTIHSGVRLEPYRNGMPRRDAVRLSLGLPRDARVVGCVARLTPIKGQTYLLEAIARLSGKIPDLRLLLVGDGEDRVALQARARREDLRGKVIFTGACVDPRPAMAAMDLVAMPSLNEGQGRAVVEAMAAGIPVVASRVGGLPEVLDGERGGLLVPPGDPEALAEAIETLVTSPERVAKLARAGRLRATRYDDRTMVDRLSTLYQSLLHEVTG